MKNTMLLKKICDFYWYDLKVNKKVEIINISNTEYNCRFDGVNDALKHFIDTMVDTNNESENGDVWDREIINHIINL